MYLRSRPIEPLCNFFTANYKCGSTPNRSNVRRDGKTSIFVATAATERLDGDVFTAGYSKRVGRVVPRHTAASATVAFIKRQTVATSRFEYLVCGILSANNAVGV